ncbi:TrbG/VirB9 family P-type conjugative transfer protein [Paraburkholderia azotifigens]|uniref:TrbG/VirB9 family P-type conjugative transfer protein n=1 Tax=Paraburkholderia azotifigens TaxID=2057004 RepID=UPI0018783B28|nr:TrbG/VirB9 family P-type conjugative transfer protein [Paraburkholderia azotifigens]
MHLASGTLHAFGDQAAWALSQNGNHIFVQPTQANSDTNLVLVTDRRVYHLLLHFIGSKKADDGSAGNTAGSFIRTPWAMRSATIALNYNYPDDDRRAALAKTNAQRVKDALATASDQGLVNMSYERSYDPAMNDITPSTCGTTIASRLSSSSRTPSCRPSPISAPAARKPYLTSISKGRTQHHRRRTGCQGVASPVGRAR